MTQKIILYHDKYTPGDDRTVTDRSTTTDIFDVQETYNEEANTTQRQHRKNPYSQEHRSKESGFITLCFTQ